MNQPNEQPEVNPLDGERGVPSVNERSGGKGKRVLALLLAGVALLGAFAVIAVMTKGKTEAGREKKAAETSTLPARTFAMPPAPPAAPPPVPAAAVPVVPQTATGPRPNLPGDAGDAQKVATLDKSRADLMIESGRPETPASADSAPAGAAYVGTRPTSGAPAATGAQEGGPLGGLLTGTKTDARQAGMLNHRDFLLAKGAFIDCALQTRLDSTVPGMTACVVTRNIYSDNGKVLLIERGSTVTGEYQSNMRQGMARIYVLWTRVKTPNGVVVNLDSPGADPLGGAGVPGYINNHFWKRFGGALMLSLVDDVARYATQNNGSSNGQLNFNSTGDATTDMASIALQNTINIPPTLYKNQGDQVGIYIARDLDFSSVYDVEPK